MALITDHGGKVWQRSGGDYNAMLRREALAWLTPLQRCRAERIRQATMLFEGRHREYFLDEGRTQGVFPALRRNLPAYFRPMNLLTNVASKIADLLFGQAARVRTDDEQLQKVLDAILDRSWLIAALPGAATDCNVCGDTFLEVTRQGGLGYIGHVPAVEMYPVGARGPDHQFASYVRFAVANVDAGGGNVRSLLLETTYAAGSITRKLFRLDAQQSGGPQRAESLALDQWPARTADGQPLAESEATGLSRPSIVYVPNGYAAISDLDGLIDLQDELHSAHTQVGRVIAKHSDPKLLAPAEAADQDGNLDAAADVLFNTGEGQYGFLTWEAQLDAAQKNEGFVLMMFCAVAEMPPSLLGIKDDATAETAAKMRLNAASALAKAARKAPTWQAALRLALSLAVEVETGAAAAAAISVEMSDGLPIDELERANTIATKRGAGVMSRRRALREEGLGRAAVEDEIKELDEEAQAAMPSTLFGEPGASPATGAGDKTVSGAAADEEPIAA